MTNAAKFPPPSRSATAFFYLTFLFIFSGALNYGVTRYFWAAPFAMYAVRYASQNFESRRPLVGVLFFIASGVLFNETMEKNAFVFPILDAGYLQEVRRPAGAKNESPGELLGESVRVTGVKVGHADLGTNVELIGSDGRTYLGNSSDPLFYSYAGGKRSEFGFQPSGPLENQVFKYAGELMWYPWLPFVAYQAIKEAFNPSLP